MTKHPLSLTSSFASSFIVAFAGCATYASPDHFETNGGAGGATAGASSNAGAATTAGAGGTSAMAGAASGGALGVSGAAGQNAAAGGASSTGGGAAGASSGGVGGGASGAASGGGADVGGAGGQNGVPANSIESISVPASGAVVASKTSLDNGELFLLKAVGTVSAGRCRFRR